MIRSVPDMNKKRPSMDLSSAARISQASSITPFLLSMNKNLKPTKLPDDFKPRDIDILCGRGRGSFEHKGNRKFKQYIEKYAKQYVDAKTKIDKGVVVASLVDSIRQEGTLFVKKDTKTQCWFDIGEYQARDKTSHAIRDFVTKCSPSKSKPILTNAATTPVASMPDSQHVQDQIGSNRQPTVRNGGRNSHEKIQTNTPSQSQASLSLCNNPLQSVPIYRNKTAPKRISNDIPMEPVSLQQLGLSYYSIPSDNKLELEVRNDPGDNLRQHVPSQIEGLVPYDQQEIEETNIPMVEGTINAMTGNNDEYFQWFERLSTLSSW